MNDERKSVLVYLTVAILVGFISSLLNRGTAVVVGLSAMAALMHGTKRLMKKDMKFFLGANGMVTYIFMWIISWTLFLGI